MITYELLQQYWWLLISVVGGALGFLLFVQGGQMMIYSLARTEDEKKLLINVLGRKWEYTFTTLVTFGGALFASFPAFYATSFGGAYWLWMLILICFVLQAISYEFQNKPGNIFGSKTYRALLYLNGLLGTVLLGVAIGTFFTGADFRVDTAAITNIVNPAMSSWGNGWYGLDAIANPRNLALGLAVFFLARTLALLFFKNRVDNKELEGRFGKYLWYNSVPFVVFFLVFLVWTLLSEGYALNRATGEIFMEPYKYLNNLVQMPLIGVLFVAGVLAVLYGIARSLLRSEYRKGIWWSGAGTVVVVGCLLLITGWNDTAFYPSSTDIQSSLTIYNASSSFFTLKVMSIVSLVIPFVAAYIIYAWRSLEKRRSTVKEIKEDEHSY